MAGRPRKPTHLKVVAGTDQPCRINKKEPKPLVSLPTKPEGLSEAASKAWDDLIKAVEPMKVLTVSDAIAIELAAITLGGVRTLAKKVNELGETTYAVQTERGGVMFKAYPEVAQMNDLIKMTKSFLASFGLTPADRSRVSMTVDDAPKNGWDAF